MKITEKSERLFPKPQKADNDNDSGTDNEIDNEIDNENDIDSGTDSGTDNGHRSASLSEAAPPLKRGFK